MPIHEPKKWTNQDLVLYHGTTDRYANAIVEEVDVSKGKPYKDFGPGFYTTTLQRQAEYWAYQLASAEAVSGKLVRPSVVRLQVSRTLVGELSHVLTFVGGYFEDEDFWSFVFHCRSGSLHHNTGRPGGGLYDVVYGPVSAFWQKRSAMQRADQISFHTAAAQLVLNQSARERLL